MSVTTVRPNSTVNLFGSYLPVGALGTLDTVLDDEPVDDSTGITTAGATAGASFTITVGYPTPTLPAGHRLKSARFRVRSTGVGGLEFMTFCGSPFQSTYWVNDYAGSFVTHTVAEFALQGVPGTITSRIDPYAGFTHVFLTELYLDFVTVYKPTSVIVAPTGPVGTNRPTLEFVAFTDPDGGSTTKYHAKIFTAAQVSAPGFNPDVTTPVIDSGEQVGTGFISYQNPDISLADGNYVAYAKMAQTFDSGAGQADWWGDYDTQTFTVAAPKPDVPDLSTTSEPSFGRVRLNVTPHTGTATTVTVQIQRSVGGGAWESLRTDLGNGQILPSAIAWDFEGVNGQVVSYRARGIWFNPFLTTGVGDITYSDWSAPVSDSWTSADDWLKHPTVPSLSFKVRLQSYVGKTTAVRQGVLQPLGASLPIVVTEARGGATGTLTILCLSDAERAAVDAISLYPYNTGVPLLLQVAPDEHEHDRWIVLGDQTRARVFDKSWVEESTDEFQWIEVEKPIGNILAWPPPVSDPDALLPSPTLYPAPTIYPHA